MTPSGWLRTGGGAAAATICSLAALLALAVPAPGEPVTVQNDSIVDFGEAVIVGNFSYGEQAGAWLTSPCDGAIIKVQILWLEGTPGHPQSLESAIHIYDGSSFPTPGSELEIMEGPAMTPGYWNEFEYLDEAQTIPLNVPVTAGQQFYVSLEFYNPTDVGNGGPSVVRDNDGCQAGRNVLYGDVEPFGWGWYNFCDLQNPLNPKGDWAIRAVIDCPGATGACCYADGICAADIEQADCEAQFGAEWHEGLSCAEITCTPRGACCRQGGCLQLVEQASCEAISGVYAGHGTDCDDDVCVAGACCILETGECLLNFEFECAALGGDYQGPGTDCDPNPCPQPQGACCFGEVCFPDQTLGQCSGAGGDWAGVGTDCADNSGNGVPDACEPTCLQKADSNCDGLVNTFDIDPFVLALNDQSAWEAAHTCDYLCANDCNDDALVNTFDIDSFVDLLAGP